MVVMDRLIFAGRLLGLAYIGIRSQCWRLFMKTKQEMCRAFAKNGGKRSFDDLQAEMLQGQKLQLLSYIISSFKLLTKTAEKCIYTLILKGVSTAKEV
ncbi:putative glycerol-3-phosphate dehydrogenase (NAD(+)) [Helianthus annuus]|nr:putative glycerol-3-phosphate dehydrogenase (NAD(+)) [Helianthus annuus]KAJ0883471.1 putative glycerol-3-phosphate dehydrogenase (NAD(+)) [Helianthus annuus]